MRATERAELEATGPAECAKLSTRVRLVRTSENLSKLIKKLLPDFSLDGFNFLTNCFFGRVTRPNTIRLPIGSAWYLYERPKLNWKSPEKSQAWRSKQSVRLYTKIMREWKFAYPKGKGVLYEIYVLLFSPNPTKTKARVRKKRKHRKGDPVRVHFCN